ncbi:hypothetical protein BKA56DRAFT_504645 [Ilyonectria sp. MPI-CAGE-AT-0026]|nr:hypothetical protein BKA56DRAFT_506338 [Ilyonectria sp. MPI-CAGE-AT-0026]KAH6953705.1 hypothetical protein BKA56DRAFT_504645 [Ilyonectria sp. MPI-CAGE-AT-0026]
MVLKWYGFYFLHVGNFDEARRIYEDLLLWGKTKGGAHQVFIFNVVHAIADTYLKQENYEQAEKLYRQALGGRLELLGEKDPDTLSSMFGLTYILYHKGELVEAQTRCKKVCSLRGEVLGPSHSRTIQARLLQEKIEGQLQVRSK